MDETTSGTLIIYACPPHRERAVLDVMEKHRLTERVTLGGSSPEPPTTLSELELGVEYYVSAMPPGNATAVANELKLAAPEACFRTF
ncbi:MAG TPA: hypothetical protein VGO89_18425, partial [Streptomyces sp.]|nr:hypothetical protein [Streptomyces sp.]